MHAKAGLHEKIDNVSMTSREKCILVAKDIDNKYRPMCYFSSGLDVFNAT